MSNDLYSELGLDSTATTQEIKSSFKKMALKLHPDKHPNSGKQEQEERTQKFLKLTNAYNVLIDPKKRQHYDKTGSITESLVLEKGDASWDDYFKTLYNNITEQEITTYIQEYKCFFSSNKILSKNVKMF